MLKPHKYNVLAWNNVAAQLLFTRYACDHMIAHIDCNTKIASFMHTT